MLEIQSLSKNYGSVRVLSDISVSAGNDEFVCLLGPSGCGKTTLLRIIAGLEKYEEGTITFGGRDINSIDARDRGFGIVFQSYSLFPSMTVGQNIGYGLKIRRTDRGAMTQKVASLLDLIGIPKLIDRYPHELSGGQQQRVAIARALAVEPSLLLLDEPLSALDARVRHEMRAEIRDIQRRLGIPTIMVTHDQDEALSMADKVVCMNHGHVEQIGTPQELYFEPSTKFVASFIGTSNFFSVDEARELFGPEAMGSARPPAGDLFMVRPEELGLQRREGAEAVIEDITFLGKVSQARIAWRGRSIMGEVRRAENLNPGDRVSLSVNPSSGRWVAA